MSIHNVIHDVHPSFQCNNLQTRGNKVQYICVIIGIINRSTIQNTTNQYLQAYCIVFSLCVFDEYDTTQMSSHVAFVFVVPSHLQDILKKESGLEIKTFQQTQSAKDIGCQTLQCQRSE